MVVVKMMMMMVQRQNVIVTALGTTDKQQEQQLHQQNVNLIRASQLFVFSPTTLSSKYVCAKP